MELRAAYRLTPALARLDDVQVVARSTSIGLGDFEMSASPALLLELLVPPRAAGTYRLAQLLLAYADPSGDMARQTVRQDMLATFAVEAAAAPHDPRVMNVVERVTAFKLQTRALEDVQRGDIAGATQKLHAAATRLLDMGETELAQTVRLQADQLEQRGEIAPEAVRTARYQTRKLTQKLD